jgi:adenine-specific DNA-methyltransferase
MMAKKKPASIPVETHKHVADKRPNIPTRETAAFAEEKGAQPFVSHRDRSLDPQLVWKGKDEQDAKPLEVPAVPIHVQEKIHPQAIIETVKAWAKQGKPVADLFADFNGLDDFAKKLEFYQHDQHWTNRLILGDSLLVMASLAEKERLRGQVQCVYFDPPYGIRFGSNWQVSTRKRDVKDAKAEDLTRQPEQIKAFRDTWELGIHSYLTYLRDRLAAARDLLTESGSVFVQIGDENVHLVRCLMDEVFGSENECGLITFKKTSGAGSFSGGTNILASVTDYLVWYAKNKEQVKYRQLYRGKSITGAGAGAYTWVALSDGTRRKATQAELESGISVGRFFRGDNLTSQTVREAQTTVFEVELDGTKYLPGKGGWKTNRVGMDRLLAARRLMGFGNTLAYVRYPAL